MIVVLISLFLFILLLSIYRIWQAFLLQSDKLKLEETGFLTDSILMFLEFILLVLILLIVEIVVLGLNDFLLPRVLMFVACFGLLIADDIVLHKKINKKTEE